MDTDVWHVLAAAVRSADRRSARTGRRPKYTDALIVKMYLWSVWHDRPLCWACERTHYNGSFRPRQLPSVAQFSRRVRTQRVRDMLAAVNAYLTRAVPSVALAFFDGKPLILRRQSQDATAKVGYASDGFAKGYKLHALANADGFITAFSVQSMNVSEVHEARQLAQYVPARTLVLADANYDSAKLYQAVNARGATLLTRLKGQPSRDPTQLQRMGPARRLAIRLWQRYAEACEYLMRKRVTIERIFAALTTAGGGLTTLPPSVRTIGRVTRWVAAKIAVYHARLQCHSDHRSVA